MRLAAALLLACFAAMAAADRFDDFVKAKMAEEKIPGLQFAVSYKGKTVMSRCYGFADVDKKTPVTANTPFEIASVSKPIVATAVMMLWEDGKFKLDDPIGKYVKEMPLAWVN
ncbi:MAG TPA: serine hydrolase domain-containing protein, partial [Fimbriimonadaceae bacterium]|nr:serine hydrolase domain-containing protein [Fimbriimonadaceae bacterium]